MLRKFLMMLIALMMMNSSASAAEKILFIPHDDRPVSRQQPAEVVAHLGYEVLMPPAEFLTRPEDLWRWFDENASSAKAAVVASDALLYGGLIPSRSHNIPAEELQSRVGNFNTLRQKNPDLKIYVFGSLMRTPSFGTPGDIEEPDYYGEFGADIFRLTGLFDKQETDILSADELAEMNDLQKKIPAKFLDDYLSRREKNFSATKSLVEFANADVIDYLIIGRDDNAPLSQTHRENRHLLAYMNELDIPKTKAQSHAGIDEYAMLLLTRAVNEIRGDVPKVHVQFNRGVGAKTIPDFSDEELGLSIDDEILIAGAIKTSNPKRADLVLLVNTDPKGKTYQTHNSLPPQTLSKKEQKYFNRNAKNFSKMVEDAVKKKLRVGIADVTFANGSDVELMNQLRKKKLLFKLQSYGGWNTATNTSGFALGSGILARRMSRDSREKILARRYLDDWGYQTFVRTKIAEELCAEPNALEIYLHLGEREAAVAEHETELMRQFAVENLPPFDYLKNLTVTNPWHRMFECAIHFGD